MNKDGHFSFGASRCNPVPPGCVDKMALVNDAGVKSTPWSAAWHQKYAPWADEFQPASPNIEPGSGICERATTFLGNVSRILNRMSGGPRGQTLCARIAERRPDCWFCRLMSRIVEPNHCAIELAYWVKHGTRAEAEWRIDNQ